MLHSHHERHFAGSAVVRDVVIGAADGLTVPFALAAGLAGAVARSSLIASAGLAEIAAGSIAMGLSGYLAARAEADHYKSEEARERREIGEMPEEERQEVLEILQRYGLEGPSLTAAVDALTREHGPWVDFMMRFELGLERPLEGRAARSALTIAGSYCIGGLLPLSPYFFFDAASRALPVSIAVALTALFGFGALKGRLTGAFWLFAGIQAAVIGALAALAAFFAARLLAPA